MPKAKPAPKRAEKKAETDGNAPALLKLHDTEEVDVDSLRPHPRNYKGHPEDQLVHIEGSLKEHGLFKNVVVAQDGTILAGHGVWTAAKKMGARRIKVVRLPLDPEDLRALKVLALDNELPKFAETDDRALSEMLREISKGLDAGGLLGTGYDEQMLAALAMVTRPATELADFSAAAEWVGMPSYEEGTTPIRLVVTFENEADRDRFMKEKKIKRDKVAGQTWSTRWPWTDREDVAGIRFEAKK
jgi:hypothetical protein